MKKRFKFKRKASTASTGNTASKTASKARTANKRAYNKHNSTAITGAGYDELQHNYCSPRWSYQIKESKMPLTFDSYSHCAFNCKYCLAYFQKALKSCNPLFPGENKNYRKLKPRCVNVNNFARLMRGEKKSQFNDYIKNRYPLEWGGLADPFCKFEDTYKVGLDILRVLDEIKYPTSFSTKGINFMYDDDYMELFERNPNWRMQLSIINLDKKRAGIIEQGVASPEDRLDAMEEYIGRTGRNCTLRLRPFIIGVSDKDDEYLELINEAYKRGCRRVSVEFFCLERRMSPGVRDRYDDISEAVGFDVVDYYGKNSPKMSGYLRLNWKIKSLYMTKMLKVCKQNKMAFYSSDSMCKDMSRSFGYAGDFDKYFTGSFSEGMIKAMKRKNRLCYWRDIEPGILKAGLQKFFWRHAEGYNTVGNETRARRWEQTMAEFLHECWNTPNDHKSPYHHFFGLLVPVSVDDDGNVVYKYTPRKGVEYIN